MAGLHAFDKTGSYEGREERTQWLCGDWLLRSGFEAADFSVFHPFLNDPDHTRPGQLETDSVLMLTGEAGAPRR